MTEFKPSSNLFEKIILRIAREKKEQNFRRRLIFGSCFFVSFYLLFSSGFWFYQQGQETGFFQFVSLVFSSFNFILGYWQSFLMLLAESLPVEAVLAVLTFFVLAAVSLKNFLRGLRFLPLRFRLN